MFLSTIFIVSPGSRGALGIRIVDYLWLVAQVAIGAGRKSTRAAGLLN